MIKHGEIYIICEIGSNWTCLEDCTRSIVKAKLCNADAVKFQLFTHEKLYGYPGNMPGEVNPEWIPILSETAHRIGLDFIVSCFDYNDISFIDKYVDFHKIASSETTNIPLLNAVLKTGRQTIFSTGGCESCDIDFLYRRKCSWIPMYCVSEYPAENVEIEIIKQMNLKYGTVGYSDHTLTNISALFAKDCGATIFEKHVSFINADTPDKCVSINQDQFYKYCKRLKSNKSPKALLIDMKPSEDMIKYHLKRDVNGKYVRLKKE